VAVDVKVGLGSSVSLGVSNTEGESVALGVADDESESLAVAVAVMSTVTETVPLG
jgi:hypothetical protein